MGNISVTIISNSDFFYLKRNVLCICN